MAGPSSGPELGDQHGGHSGLLASPSEGGAPSVCPLAVPRGQLSPPLRASSLRCREKMLQDAGLTYQQFKNCRDNLSSWLEHLPPNQLRPSDGPSQIAYKLQAQQVRRGWGCRRPRGRSGHTRFPGSPALPQGGPPARLWPPSGQCSKRPHSSDPGGLGQHHPLHTHTAPQRASPALSGLPWAVGSMLLVFQLLLHPLPRTCQASTMQWP